MKNKENLVALKLFGIEIVWCQNGPQRNWRHQKWLRRNCSAEKSCSLHSFPAWRSAIKRYSVKISWQVRFLCPWARHFNRIASTIEWLNRH